LYTHTLEPLERADGIQELPVAQSKGKIWLKNGKLHPKQNLRRNKNFRVRNPQSLAIVRSGSATERTQKFPTLRKNAKADVCVVGAGIAGLTTGYLLALEGKTVIIIDKNSVGQGDTVNTSAYFSNEIDATYREVAPLHFENGARIAAESHTAAISKIESIVAADGIDCDFASGAIPAMSQMFLSPREIVA
jgi:NADPH-dependent 2,4-dienoyl-CoA reductase/sulfur reductase-like enzyme